MAWTVNLYCLTVCELEGFTSQGLFFQDTKGPRRQPGAPSISPRYGHILRCPRSKHSVLAAQIAPGNASWYGHLQLLAWRCLITLMRERSTKCVQERWSKPQSWTPFFNAAPNSKQNTAAKVAQCFEFQFHAFSLRLCNFRKATSTSPFCSLLHPHTAMPLLPPFFRAILQPSYF